MNTKGILITGTDTGVGKTCVTTLIAREGRAEGLAVGTYKPACSGAEFPVGEMPLWSDVEELSRAIGNSFPRERIGPQRFTAPVAPPVAARLEEREVDTTLLVEGAVWWNGRVELLVVEGAGGLLCPLSNAMTVADLAGELRLPLIVVTRLGLGSINHTLLTIEVAQRRRLPIAGIILNEVDQPADNAEDRNEQVEIERCCNVPILGRLRYQQPDRLIHSSTTGRINWLDLAGPMAIG